MHSAACAHTCQLFGVHSSISDPVQPVALFRVCWDPLRSHIRLLMQWPYLAASVRAGSMAGGAWAINAANKVYGGLAVRCPSALPGSRAAVLFLPATPKGGLLRCAAELRGASDSFSLHVHKVHLCRLGCVIRECPS